jgi:hypothetical protein
MDLKVWTAVFAIVVWLTLGGCATPVPAISPYVSPSDGKVYRYGEFCGPSFPAFSSRTDTAVREQELNALAPVDHVDAACRAHDICYEAFTHDNAFCDQMLADLLSFNARNSVQVDRDFETVGYYDVSSCHNLSAEIQAGMAHKGAARKYAAYFTTQDGSYNAGAPILGSLLWFGIDTVMRLPANALIGWPKEGQCKAKVSNESAMKGAVAQSAEKAFAAAVCNRFLPPYDGTNDLVLKRYSDQRRQSAQRCLTVVMKVVNGRLDPGTFVNLDTQEAARPTDWRSLQHARDCIATLLGPPNTQDWRRLEAAVPGMRDCIASLPTSQLRSPRQ